MSENYRPLDPLFKALARMAFEEGCSYHIGSCNNCEFQKADGSDCAYWKDSAAKRRLMELEYPVDIKIENPGITDKDILDWVDRGALDQIEAVEYRLKRGMDKSFRDSVKWHIENGID